MSGCRKTWEGSMIDELPTWYRMRNECSSMSRRDYQPGHFPHFELEVDLAYRQHWFVAGITRPLKIQLFGTNLDSALTPRPTIGVWFWLSDSVVEAVKFKFPLALGTIETFLVNVALRECWVPHFCWLTLIALYVYVDENKWGRYSSTQFLLSWIGFKGVGLHYVFFVHHA
jgi:hypothetical protein